MNRITTGYSTAASGTYSWGETYTIDPWGNLNIAPMGGKAHGGTFGNASNNNNQALGLSYDAAGNVTNYLNAYVYDPENRIQSGGGNIYTYDADGQRVRKDANGAATEYVSFLGNVIAEKNPGTGAWTDYIFGNGKRLAKDTSNNASGAQYYQDDHLGSARIMTDNAGTVISNCTFNPFGEQVGCSPDNPSNHYRFTGKERDGESGLDDFGARYFSSSMGRWMTTDWAAKPVTVPYAQFGDPQSLNLYGYVRNTPTTGIDLDGHQSGVETATGWICITCMQAGIEIFTNPSRAWADAKQAAAALVQSTINMLPIGDNKPGPTFVVPTGPQVPNSAVGHMTVTGLTLATLALPLPKGSTVVDLTAVVKAPSVIEAAAVESTSLIRMYGPFYRLDANAQAIADSKVLFGTPARNIYASDTAAVKAYVGELPAGQTGIEFYTPFAPDSVGAGTQGSTAWWYGEPYSDVTSIPISPSNVVPPQ